MFSALDTFIAHLTTALPLVLVLLGFLVVSRAVFGLVGRVQGCNYAEEATGRDNPAVMIRFTGIIVAVAFVFASILRPSESGLQGDLTLAVQYGLLSIILILVSGFVNDKVILYGFNNNSEVVLKRNCAVAIVECATALATAYNCIGALVDFHGGIVVALGWFVLGQVFLFALSLLFRIAIPKLFDELREQNLGCAFALGGLLLAGGMAFGDAIHGEFNGWLSDLSNVGLSIVAWLIVVVLPTLAVANFLIIPGKRALKEITEDNNTGVGLTVGAMLVAVTSGFLVLLG